jgi:hypothetical protein
MSWQMPAPSQSRSVPHGVFAGAFAGDTHSTPPALPHARVPRTQPASSVLHEPPMADSHPFVGDPSQSPKPALHVNPQPTPLQFDTEFVRESQGEQRDPQVATDVLSTQLDPQTWNPVLQLIPHVPEAQVEMPFDGRVQTFPQAPQLATSPLGSTHVLPH